MPRPSASELTLPAADQDLAAKRALVSRVVASDLFQKAPRLRAFLVHVADCTLENRLADVREQAIAEQVFGRRPDFQAAEDSIVRAEARNLRKRLETYFETEGKHEPLVITIPKGGYALAFERRAAQLQESSVASASVGPVSRSSRWLPAVCAVLAVLLALAIGLAFYWRGAATSPTGSVAGAAKRIMPLRSLLNDRDETLIVTSDTALMQISWLARKQITLDDYIARTYPSVPNVNPPDLIRNLNLYEFTDGREMAIVGRILNRNPDSAAHVLLRSGHQVQLQDFANHNVILIGSPVSNPWAQIFEDRLNFRCEFGKDGLIHFRDVAANGSSMIHPSAEDAKLNRAYARIAFLPAAAGRSCALLIAGTTAQATEAAGRLVTDTDRFSEMLRGAGLDPNGEPRFFELLIRSSNFVGGGLHPELVQSRLKTAPEN